MNPDVLMGEQPIHEALLGGATGTGKSFLSDTTVMYQVYLAECFKGPQQLFNLSVTTPMVWQLQSVSPTVTKRVLYMPLRSTFLAMPHVARWIPYDKTMESELRLEQNIMIVPASAALQSIVGQAIPGGILDEVNFMHIIEESKQVAGPAGLGGHYDQAEIVYRNISRRRKRSFTTRGVSIGCLCVISSTRYIGDFLDRRIDEVEAFKEPNIFVARRKQYDVNPLYEREPNGSFKGGTFKVLIGTDTYPTRVLNDDEQAGVHYPEHGMVENVPLSFKPDFLRDPEGSQRDVIGVASNAITPFIARREKIVDATTRGFEFGLRPWVFKQNVDLMLDGMPQIIENNLPENRDSPRYIHIDLSATTDRCGIAVVRVAGQEVVTRENGLVEVLPVYIVEAAITVQPSPTHHIDPSEIRQWVMRLVRFYKFNVAHVSYDGFQSLESINLFRRAGIISRNLSVDRTTEGYTVFRRALYDDRIIMVDNPLLRQELSALEYLAKKDHIDHPPRGSKDCSDAVAGAVFAASRNRVTVGGGVVEEDGSTVRTAGTRQRPVGRLRPRGRPLR